LICLSDASKRIIPELGCFEHRRIIPPSGVLGREPLLKRRQLRVVESKWEGQWGE
jgi:hypothetical protein